MSGGAATTTGTTFQENVAAWFACLVLADVKAPPVAGLPSTVALDAVSAETIQPVDDLKVRSSDDGQLFVQVKAGALSCSAKNERFVSAFRQFVQQFHSGYTSYGNERRELDQSRDRLILVVSGDTSDMIKNELRALLDTMRPCSDAAAFAETRMGLSAPQKKQLEIVEGIVAEQCTLLNIATNSPEQTQRLLRLTYVLSLDFGTTGMALREAHALLKESVLFDPSRSDEAWNLLITTVRTFAPSRMGGDRSYFRGVLQQHGLIPRPNAAAEAAIRVLKNRSASFELHIEPFSEIIFRGEKVHIDRPVVLHLISEAASGGILVTGSAGAGKSGCLHEFVRKVSSSGSDVLLLAVDQLAATTFGELDRELGLPLNRDLVDLLSEWSGPSPAYLVIDALDAARTTHGLTALCGRIDQIRRRAPRWKVIASVREFDLRHSREIRQLFAGDSAAEHTKDEFQGVRHIYVTSLTDEELSDFGGKARDVAQARLSISAEFQELTRNPFNLRLLTELVDRNVDTTRLTRVRTQVGLLDLYWDDRVDKLNDESLRAGLTECVHRMVARRSLSLLESELQQSHGSWLSRLASVTLLNISKPFLPGSERQISFVHNILYDYAVARLLLKDLPETVIEWLGQTENQDLLLAIRPSVVLAFQRLWHASDDRQAFWQRAIPFVAKPSMRLIGKIIAADVAAIEFRQVDDVSPLLSKLSSPESETVGTVLRFTLQAAIAHFQQDPQRFPLWGASAPDWLGLAALLSERHASVAAWQVRNLLAHLP